MREAVCIYLERWEFLLILPAPSLLRARVEATNTSPLMRENTPLLLHASQPRAEVRGVRSDQSCGKSGLIHPTQEDPHHHHRVHPPPIARPQGFGRRVLPDRGVQPPLPPRHAAHAQRQSEVRELVGRPSEPGNHAAIQGGSGGEQRGNVRA